MVDTHIIIVFLVALHHHVQRNCSLVSFFFYDISDIFSELSFHGKPRLFYYPFPIKFPNIQFQLIKKPLYSRTQIICIAMYRARVYGK